MSTADSEDPPCWTCWSVAQCTGFRVLTCRWCREAERQPDAAHPRAARATPPVGTTRPRKVNGKAIPEALWTSIEAALVELCTNATEPLIPRARVVVGRLFQDAGLEAPTEQAVRVWVRHCKKTLAPPSTEVASSRAEPAASPPSMEVASPRAEPAASPPSMEVASPRAEPAASPPSMEVASPRAEVVVPRRRPVLRCALCDRAPAPFRDCPAPFQGLCALHRAKAWMVRELYGLTPEDAIQWIRIATAR